MTSILTVAFMAFFVLTGGASAESSRVSVQIRAESVEEVQEAYSVRLTGYNAVPAQTDSDPMTTASGAYSNPEIIAARSVDLARELPFGTVIEFVIPETSKAPCGLSSVEYLVGLRVVADSMHPRKRNQIDILFDNNDVVRLGGKRKNPAVVLGVCKGIEVRVVGYVDIREIPKTQTELAAQIGTAVLAASN